MGHRLGLHARASAKLVRLSEGFRSQISLSCEGDDRNLEADARSILEILLLAVGQGTRMRVQAEGDDEQEAVEAICGYLTSE